jgi:hypothetical protein
VSDCIPIPRSAQLSVTKSTGMQASPSRTRPSALFPRGRPFLSACAAALGAVLVITNAVAAQPITYLGPPSNATPPFLPLGSFHRAAINHRTGKKPELVFLGTQIEDGSAIERWPVVKALDQFGAFRDVGMVLTHNCSVTYLYKKIDCSGGPTAFAPSASFDLRRARYRSKYLSFSGTELIDRELRLKPESQLSTIQRTLFNRYVRRTDYSSWHDGVWYTAAGGSPPGSEAGHQFPLVAIGGYVETGANVVTGSDIGTTAKWLPFAQIQQTLRSGKRVGGASDTLIPDVNAEANIITALICHADGREPANVCNRSVIRSMWRYVK